MTSELAIQRRQSRQHTRVRGGDRSSAVFYYGRDGAAASVRNDRTMHNFAGGPSRDYRGHGPTGRTGRGAGAEARHGSFDAGCATNRRDLASADMYRSG